MSTDSTGEVPNATDQYRPDFRICRRWSVLSMLCLLLFPLLLNGCGGSSDDPFANNARGGAARANNYSSVSVAPPGSFEEVRFDTLETGFLGLPLSISGERMAVVAGNRQLALIRYDKLEWVYRFGEGEYPLPELACDSLGKIYVATTNRLLCALDPTGKLLWKKPLGKAGEQEFALPTLPLTVPGGIVIGTTEGVMKGFDVAGNEKWSRRCGAELVRTVAYDPEIGVVFGITHNDYLHSDTIVVLDEAGKERKSIPLTNLRIEYGPMIVGDYVIAGAAGTDREGKYTPVVLALDKTGKEIWRAPLKVLPLGIAADDEGNIYVTGGGGSQMSGGVVASFGPDGKRRWEVGLTESVPATPTAIAGGICFVAVRDRTLGLYSYNSDGGLLKFTSIDALAEVTPIPAILPYGQILLAGADQPVMLKGR